MDNLSKEYPWIIQEKLVKLQYKRLLKHNLYPGGKMVMIQNTSFNPQCRNPTYCPRRKEN